MHSTASGVQAVQLLIMYGADASIQNRYKQTARYLALSEECLQLFDLLERDGELCRHDLRDRLDDDRAEAAALKEEAAAEHERLCAPPPDVRLESLSVSLKSWNYRGLITLHVSTHSAN